MIGPAPIVLARVLNFVHPATPWYRALWCPSSDSALAEVIEYAEVASETGTKNDGLCYVAKSLAAQVDRDWGLGSAEVRVALRSALAKVASLGAKAYPTPAELEALRQWRDRTASGYLERWSTALDQPDVEAESAARRIASALLDWGLDARQVATLAVPRADESEVDTLRRLLDTAHSTLVKGRQRHTVILPLAARSGRVRRLGEVLDRERTIELLAGRGTATDAGENDVVCGVVVEVDAFDPWSAALEAARRLRRLTVVAKASGEQSDLRHSGIALVQGTTQAISLDDGRRRVVVPNLARDRAGDIDWPEPFHNALELAGSMSDESPAVAVSSGWAAIEGLFARGAEPSAGTLAADRAAGVVACAWPRGELGTLGAQYFRERGMPSRTAGKMARFVADQIRSGDPLAFESDRDLAGLLRMTDLFRSPAPVMERTVGYLRDAFRRLYNQRNLVMHQATHRSTLLDVTVRTMTPLVAAALDRVAYGYRWDNSPLALAERASIEIALLSGNGARRVESL